jgi:hypothetical protein
MNDRAPISHPHDYYVDLVIRAPKVPPDEFTPPELFGNNFWRLFQSLFGAEKAADPQEYRKNLYVPLNRVEAECAGPWAQFLEHNRDLVRQIDTALNQYQVYNELLMHKVNLAGEGRDRNDYSEPEAFEALGLKEVGIYACRQLNPLLREASDRMKKEGINSEEYF